MSKWVLTNHTTIVFSTRHGIDEERCGGGSNGEPRLAQPFPDEPSPAHQHPINQQEGEFHLFPLQEKHPEQVSDQLLYRAIRYPNFQSAVSRAGPEIAVEGCQ